tara:strand:- start:234 stop:1226 length:993 start_codon:yes stop_codon:yes gene_type:complete
MTITNLYNKVYNKDFLNNTLPDKCAKLIIADPPYFEVKGEFDFIWNSFEDYLKDVEKWAIECKRVLADNGTLFWWGMDRKLAYAQVILDKYFNLIGTPVWEKPSNPNEWDTRRTFPERAAERLLMYDNGDDRSGLEMIMASKDCFKDIKKYLDNELKKSGYNLTTIKKVLKNQMGSHYFGFSKREKTQFAFPTLEHYNKLQSTGYFNKKYKELRLEYEELRLEYEELRLEYEELRRPFNNYLSLTDVFRFSRENNKYKHDTKKPEKLTRALILTCSRKNDLVVVPFSGSGTECAMAAKEDRNFIGFDIEQKYVDMANKRIEQHKAQQRLF